MDLRTQRLAAALGATCLTMTSLACDTSASSEPVALGGDAAIAPAAEAGAGSTGGSSPSTTGGDPTSSDGDSGMALASDAGTSGSDPSPQREFRAEVWADNWFAAYLDESLLKEDSVPITTERSFNAESFTFEARYPFTLNFVVKDFKQDDSGLEYIGQPNQQMGDGGFIAQITDVLSGARVAVTNAAWKCLVIQRAPLNPSCEHDPAPLESCQFEAMNEPVGWKVQGFDRQSWPSASVYTEQEVGPKEGYYEITWDPQAELIWADDLKTANTLLCTFTVEVP